MSGIRFLYPNAVAKPIEELTLCIVEQGERLSLDLKNFELKATVKDGFDVLGDVPEYTQKGYISLPDKAYCYSFAVMKIEVAVDDGETYFI